jgi:hypothetical protein
MFCSSCGKEVSKGEGFCSHCGAPLSDSSGNAGRGGKQFRTLTVHRPAQLNMGIRSISIYIDNTPYTVLKRAGASDSFQIDTNPHSFSATGPNSNCAGAIPPGDEDISIEVKFNFFGNVVAEIS